MPKLAQALDQVSEYTGRAVAWLTTALVWLICIYVMMRYLFSTPLLWLQELQWHLFALIFLLGAAYTFKADAHVRVDVFYARFSPKGKAWVNLIGILAFLFPFCLVIIFRSWEFVSSSWAVQESSPDPGGLPARYVIKAALPLSFVLLTLQGLAEALRSVSVIRQKK